MSATKNPIEIQQLADGNMYAKLSVVFYDDGHANYLHLMYIDKAIEIEISGKPVSCTLVFAVCDESNFAKITPHHSEEIEQLICSKKADQVTFNHRDSGIGNLQ